MAPQLIPGFILELVTIIGRRDAQEMRRALERSRRITPENLQQVSRKTRTEYGLVISDLFAALVTA